jgi:hypothetical protein
LAITRHLRLSICAIVAAAACAAVPGAAAMPRGDPATAHAVTQRHQASRHQRALMRRKLARRLRANPGLAMRRSFLREASLLDFRLPLTVRLSRSNGQGGYETSDDQLEIKWDDSTVPWPLAGGAPAAPQTTSIAGRFTMEASFGGDASGYGELGAMETVQGAAINMTASAFTISDFQPACLSGPQLQTTAQPIAVSSAGFRHGLLNLFSQTIRGTLAVRMTFPAIGVPSCGGTPFTTVPVDNTTAPAMPIWFSGTFRMSPSITADGKIRFGRITVDDSETPQLDNFAYVRSCTGAVTCDAMQFPARLKVKKLTAEVLLGDIG